MEPLSIEITGDKKSFRPKEMLSGQVSWALDKRPAKIFLRLFWYTKGKGTEDVGVVHEIAFDYPKPKEKRSFQIQLPESPYSFSGKLVALIWALELVVNHPEVVVRKEIIIAPLGCEIDLLKYAGENL